MSTLLRSLQQSGSAALVALAIAACGPTAVHHGTSGDDAGIGSSNAHVMTGISVTPTNPLIQLDLNMPGSQDFTVSGEYEDGTTDDQTANATFSVVNPVVGTITGATLSIPAFTTAMATTSLINATVGTFTGQAQITVAAYRNSGSDQDFFFILPYQDPGGNTTKPLVFSTAIPSLDVFFLMDTTGSMAPEIGNLKTALTGTVIPGIKAAVTDSQFGVGAFDDFPVSPYDAATCSGDGTPDQPFKLRQPITATTSLVTAAVAGLTNATGGTIGCGGDLPEAGIEAIYQAATGNGLTGPSPTAVPMNHNGVGGVEFRSTTMPVIVSITDAISHGVGETDVAACDGGPTDLVPYNSTIAAFAHSRAQTEAALSTICARVVGIAAVETPAGTACDGQEYLTAISTATGARVPPGAWDVGVRPAGCSSTQCCTGENGVGRATDTDNLCPMVFQAGTDGSGVSASIVTRIHILTRLATFDVTHSTIGNPTDTMGNPLMLPHTTADFIKSIVPTDFTLPPPPPNLPNPTFDSMNFHNVTPGTKLGFDVNAFNDFVPQTDQAQIFSASIQVLAGGCTPLDTRAVLILVPPTPITIQ